MSWLTDYKSSIKMVAVEEYFDLYFYRPLAFVLVKLIYPTNITPNQLTLAAIGLGIIAGFQYAQGLPNGFIYGAVFFVLYNICLLYTSPSPRDRTRSRMPSSA